MDDIDVSRIAFDAACELAESQQAELTRLRAEVDALKLQRAAAEIVGRETANIVLSQAAEVESLRDALHQISLCSQNSSSNKEECGRIARRALEKK